MVNQNTETSDARRPNIVFILADDQGAWALGSAGNPEVQTPNLDRIASAGIRFDNFFCASPVCSPARASILTGRIPSQHGVHDWLRKGNLNSERTPGLGWGDDREIAYLKGMPATTEVLADHGYTCGISGKWHLGDSLQPQKGFSYWHIFPYGGGSYFNGYFIREGRIERDKRYLTDVITEGALAFLDAREGGEGPFYLSVHYTAPHSPWDRHEHPRELLALYDDCPFESCPEVSGGHPWQINSAPRGKGERRRELLAGYYAAITGLDRGVGQILAKLEAMGELDNTLLIFTSDNGMNMGHHGIWGKGNGTFPQNMYDTSVKVPMLMALPGRLPQGQVDEHLLSHYDLMPTLLDYLGLESAVPADALPGRSFAPLLRGESLDDREHVVVFDEYGPVRMIRTREWKYVHRYPYGPHELYDLTRDPDEKRNLVDDVDLQDVVAAMKGRLETWCARYVDPALDGTKEPVTGKGQIDRAGTTGEGRRAYEDDWWYIDEDGRRRDDQAFFLGKVMRKGGDDEMAKHSHKRPTKLERFWYGATYYPEHWSPEDREHDAERMAEAGFNCVRMAEFAWDLLEPEEGEFHFELFDEVIAELGAKGIHTILGTPTATPPRWLTRAHPEMLRVDADGVRMQHGSRQHVCPSGETFRAYSRKITRAMADHYADQPFVIGWQTDNELNCHFSECHCEACQGAFRDFLRDRYHGDIGALNSAWGTAFWSQTYRDFDEIETPKNGKPAYANPAHQLDYYLFISWNTARFQHEQVQILRTRGSHWFVTHNGTFAHIDYRGEFGRDLDFLSYDVYPFFDTDHNHRSVSQAFNLDQARAWTGNFMVPEQQSGPGAQGHYMHDTAEPGEVRRMAYLSIARGADSLLFFRWRTCRFGAEAYWCGILDHDNVPRGRYDEVKQLGEELRTVGPELLGTHVRVDVGVAAADVDVHDAHATMSFGLPSPKQVAETVHAAFLKQGYAVGCVHPSDDLTGLKVLVIPHWTLFDPAWEPNLRAFVENGGVLVLGARTATRDLNNNVIADTPPGVLGGYQGLAGVRVGETSRQNAPGQRELTVRFYPGEARVTSRDWYERVEAQPGTTIIARWLERHLRMKAAVTLKKVGEGAVIYVGTYLNEEIIEGLMPHFKAYHEDFAPVWPDVPAAVQVVVRESEEKRLWFFINTSDTMANVATLPAGVDLITGKETGTARHYFQAHEVLVIKED